MRKEKRLLFADDTAASLLKSRRIVIENHPALPLLTCPPAIEVAPEDGSHINGHIKTLCSILCCSD